MRFLLLMCLMSCAAGAADVRSWTSLEQLRAGDPVTVVSRDGKTVKGPLARVTEDSISLQVDGAERGVPRTDVVRVELRSGNRRMRNLLIGTGIGAAAGLILDKTVGTYLRNEASDPSPAVWLAPIGAGAGIGALIPSYRVVYRAPGK